MSNEYGKRRELVAFKINQLFEKNDVPVEYVVEEIRKRSGSILNNIVSIDEDTIYNILNNKYTPTFLEAMLITQVFNKSIEIFFY